jgi:endonuclease YncB( thermonuclease family)
MGLGSTTLLKKHTNPFTNMCKKKKNDEKDNNVIEGIKDNKDEKDNKVIECNKEIKEETHITKRGRGRPKKKISSENKFLRKMKIEELKNALIAATYDTTPNLNLNGYKGLCKVVKVYDGDTVHVAIEVFGNIYRIKCRLSGIDTAELVTDDPLEEKIAEKAKKVVDDFTSNRLLWLVVHCNDKYGGRYVSSIYPDVTETEASSISHILLNQGLAYPYKGGEKTPFRQWFKEK